MARFQIECVCGWRLESNDKELVIRATAEHDKKCPVTNAGK